MKLTRIHFEAARRSLADKPHMKLTAHDALVAVLDAYQRVEKMLVNLGTDIAAMRECDRKRTMKAIEAELRLALYGEE